MAKTLYTSFVDREHAVKAAGALLDRGVKNDHLSLIAHGTEADLAAFGGKDLRDRDREVEEVDDAEGSAKHGLSTTTGEDAAVGAAKGAGWGLAVGAVAALAAIWLPGVGLVVGSGALATALGGTALATGAGAVAGGVHGYLKDQGVPPEKVEEYGKVVEGGGALLAVMLPSGDVDEAAAREVLDKYGATNFGAYDAARA